MRQIVLQPAPSVVKVRERRGNDRSRLGGGAARVAQQVVLLDRPRRDAGDGEQNERDEAGPPDARVAVDEDPARVGVRVCSQHSSECGGVFIKDARVAACERDGERTEPVGRVAR